MGMFDNYENIPSDYVPNNMYPHIIPETLSIETDNVELETNLAGKQNYVWDFGNSFVLKFDTKVNISVEDDAIIFDEIGEYPTDETEGVIGQKAYNTRDIKAWQLTSITVEDNDNEDIYHYIWSELDDFVYTEGGKDITLSMDLSDKTVNIVFLNWRNEEFYTEEIVPVDNLLIFDMTADKSLTFIKGIYYLHIMIDNNLYYEITCRVN